MEDFFSALPLRRSIFFYYYFAVWQLLCIFVATNVIKYEKDKQMGLQIVVTDTVDNCIIMFV